MRLRCPTLDEMRAREPARFRFAHCEVDVATRSLVRDGRGVEVEPRVFDLLVFLLENRHRVVSTEELVATLWGGTAVTQSSVSRAVCKARRAVGDDGETQRVIETLHSRGFRFVAPVSSPGPDASAELRSAAPSRGAGPAARDADLAPRRGPA